MDFILCFCRGLVSWCFEPSQSLGIISGLVEGYRNKLMHVHIQVIVTERLGELLPYSLIVKCFVLIEDDIFFFSGGGMMLGEKGDGCACHRICSYT